MRAGNALLDADMATVAGWLRSGYGWWTAELRALLPAGWLARRTRRGARLEWRGPGDWDLHGDGPVEVLVNPAQGLMRDVALPPLGEADLQKLVALDADRLLPLQADRLVIGARFDQARPGTVAVACMERGKAKAMLDELAAAQVPVSRVALCGRGGPESAVDLTRAMAELATLAGQDGARSLWFAILAFAFLCNLGILVWRDQQSVARLEELVEGQSPAVMAAQRISGRITAASRSASALAARRRQRDPLAPLAAVTRSLPAGAWVQRFEWDGQTMRISGYKQPTANIVGALRGSGAFADVRMAPTDAMADTPGGQPFDVTARYTGGRR